MPKLQSANQNNLKVQKTIGLEKWISDRINEESRTQQRNKSYIVNQALIEYFHKIDTLKIERMEKEQ